MIQMGNGCGSCRMHENVAFGLIKLYGWFAEKCDDFKKSKETQAQEADEKCSVIDTKIKSKEAMAA